MKHYGNFLIALSAVLILLSGCSYIERVSGDRAAWAEKAQSDVTIGVAYPVKEIDSTTQYIKGIKLAVDEINSNDGINGRKIKLLVEDDAASVTTGAAIAQSFTENPEIMAVVGHWNSRVSVAVAGIYEKAGIVMMTPASTSPELAQKGYKYIFSQIPSDEKIGKVMAEYAAQKGYERIIIYYADDEYGRGLANSFEDNAKINGIKVVDRVTEFGNGQYFQSLLDRWNAFSYDAFFIADVMPDGGAFVEKLRSNGIHTPILGATGLDRSSFIEMLGDRADGTVVPTLFNPHSTNPQTKLFVSNFEDRYRKQPDVWAAQGYETIKILAYAIEKAQSTVPSEIASALHKLENWEGITGTLHFHESGKIEGKIITKKVVENGKFQYLEN